MSNVIHVDFRAPPEPEVAERIKQNVAKVFDGLEVDRSALAAALYDDWERRLTEIDPLFAFDVRVQAFADQREQEVADAVTRSIVGQVQDHYRRVHHRVCLEIYNASFESAQRLASALQLPGGR